MTKKYGKDTFRRSKKKILHKKGINTKKRGLRGGLKLSSLFRSSASQPQVDDQIHGIYGSALNVNDSMKLSRLTSSDCTNLLGQIIANPTKSLTSNAETEVRLCKQKFYSDLKVKFPRPDSMEGVEYFDTQLSTKSNPVQTLTLRNCKVIKKLVYSDRFNGLYEYRIFSPAVSTLPPIGGTQKETPVGTFTQFPVSVLLTMAGQETPFSFDSFYNTDDRKEYFSDYMSCLQNVKKKFGPDVVTAKDVFQFDKFSSSSKLREFGKSEKCKIVLVAGNIGTKIQDPSNKGAIVVTPSQFSGTEYLDPESGPGTTLEQYKNDPTGGPLAQLSVCPPVAEVILLHGARTGFNSDFLVINAIDDVIKELHTLGITSLTLNNGYLEVPANLQSEEDLDLTDSQNPPKTAIAIFDSLSQKLKMLQTDDVPTNGLKPPVQYTEFNWQSTSKVSLIYASAVPLNYQTAINPQKSTLQYCVAGFDLVAQYFGAMVSAYYRKKQQQLLLESTALAAAAAAAARAPDALAKQTEHQDLVKAGLANPTKLFLTPLGGGVFKNPREMIACSALLSYYQAQQLLPNFDDKVQVIFLAWNGIGPRECPCPQECSDFSEFFNSSTTDTETNLVINGCVPKKLKYQEVMLEIQREREEIKNKKKNEEVTESKTLVGNPTPEILVDTAKEAPNANIEMLGKQKPEEAEQPPPDAVADVISENVKKLTPKVKLEVPPEVKEPLSTEQSSEEPLQRYTEWLEKIKKQKIDTEREKDNFDTSKKEEITKIAKIANDLNKQFPDLNDFNKPGYTDIMKKLNQLKIEHNKQMKSYESSLETNDKFISALTTIIDMIENNNTKLPDGYYLTYMYKLITQKNKQQGSTATGAKISSSGGPVAPLGELGGGSKSRRRHPHKPARKTTRKSKSKSKSKSKPKTHRRRRAHHSRTRKHKKYTSRRR